MTNTIYTKARQLKGKCEICGHWVRKRDSFTTSGTDGHGALTGLAHKECKEKQKGEGK